MGSMTKAFILIAMVACLTSVAHAIAGQAQLSTLLHTRHRALALKTVAFHGLAQAIALNITGSNSTEYVSKIAITDTLYMFSAK
ncbi:hypothetical protein Tco_0345834 [Tanacetum coccineum]